MQCSVTSKKLTIIDPAQTLKQQKLKSTKCYHQIDSPIILYFYYFHCLQILISVPFQT